MELQRAFDFEAGEKRARAMRDALAPYRLPLHAESLVVLFSQEGERCTINGQRCLKLEISSRNGGKKLGCVANSFLLAVRKLQELEVLEIVARAQSRIYYLSRERLDELVPISDGPVDELGLFADRTVQPLCSTVQDCAATVQPARVRVLDKSLSRVPCSNREEHVHGDAAQPLNSFEPPRSSDAESGDPAGNRRTHDGQAYDPSPESVSHGTGFRNVTLRTLTDDQVRRLDVLALRAAFLDAVSPSNKFLRDDRDDKRKFLALCHHAANCPGINYPARVVYAAIKRYNFEAVNQVSWDWSGKFLRESESARSKTQEVLAETDP